MLKELLEFLRKWSSWKIMQLVMFVAEWLWGVRNKYFLSAWTQIHVCSHPLLRKSSVFVSNELKTMVEIAFGLKINSVRNRVIAETRKIILIYLHLCNAKKRRKLTSKIQLFLVWLIVNYYYFFSHF